MAICRMNAGCMFALHDTPYAMCRTSSNTLWYLYNHRTITSDILPDSIPYMPQSMT